MDSVAEIFCFANCIVRYFYAFLVYPRPVLLQSYGARHASGTFYVLRLLFCGKILTERTGFTERIVRDNLCPEHEIS